MLTTRHISLIVFLAAFPVVGILIWKLRPSPPRAVAMVLAGFYLAAVAGVVFGGIPIDPDLLEDLRSEAGGNWVPLRSLTPIMSFSGSNLLFKIGNLLLLAPLGVLLPVLSHRFRRLGSVVFLGLALSMTIELTQLLGSTVLGYGYRVFQVEDIMLNTLGIVLGWAVWRGYRQLSSNPAGRSASPR